MPRIDPQQLLTCLNVLLSPDGGILSMNEVARLANLMTKFSKKLVSKCIYILILKNTVPDLLFAFMGVGGWDLIQIWLQDGIQNKNWALVTELLELLLLTPVDVDRLKSNNLPKIVKGLTKREDLKGIQLLSTQLVQQWLKIVKEVTKKESIRSEYDDKENTDSTETYNNAATDSSTVNTVDISANSATLVDSDANTYTADNGYRLVVKDGKQILCKIVEDEDSVDKANNKYISNDTEQAKKSSSSSTKHRSSSSSKSSRDKDRSSSKSRDKSSSSSKSRSSSSSSSRDKERRNSSSHSSSSSKHRSSSSSSSSKSSSKDRDRDRRDSKEKQADKDKDTLAKIQPPSLSKVGRIPKKTDSSKREDTKPTPKPSFSVEVRKSTEEKPKTVKIFNSKMRSTGLMDEAKPPPPRNATKKPANSPKRSLSPPRDGSTVAAATTTPPEKKSRPSDPEPATKPERPGSIKLIPPKPKPAFLQESDIFMDALAASATKSPKKRKRKLSVSKDAPTSPPAASKPTITSPTSLKNITPANFYQDTLQTESIDLAEADNNKDDNNEEEISKESPEEPSSDEAAAAAAPEPSPTTKTDINGLKGVLSYAKRKGPKKSIRWKPEGDLVEIQYFELDETERINVTKTFMDMARMEMSGEREALLKSRKLINEDIMDAQTAWRTLHEIDLPTPLVVPGFKSIEKDIQFAREKNVLQAIYFSKLMLPDSGAEPEPETHPMSDPVSMPLEDGDHADDALPIHSWPEPKGSPPHQVAHPPLNIFNNNNPGMMPPNFPPAGPPGAPMLHPGMVPPFGPDNFMPPPPGMGGVEWANDPIMMGAGGGPPLQNGMFNNGPPPNFLPNKVLPPPPQQFGPPMNGFVPPPGAGGGFPRGRGGHFNNMMRGGRGGSGWVRMSGNNNPQQWNRLNGPPPGAPVGAKRGRFCNNVKNHGFCRNRDTCPFIHPN